MGLLPINTRQVERKRNRVQFDVLASQSADEPFVSIGYIDGEIDEFIRTESLKAEGSITFANNEGYRNTIRFVASTYTLLTNAGITNIERLTEGLWILQFKEQYGTIQFVTPYPVSLRTTSQVRTGNLKAQGTVVETFFYTETLDWIKDSSPSVPTRIKPSPVIVGALPAPQSMCLDLDEGITFRLSNDAIPVRLRPLVVYDIEVFRTANYQNLVASKLDIPFSDIVDADYVVTSDTQLTGFSDLQKGRVYYVRIVAKYLGLSSLPLEFAIGFAFAPHDWVSPDTPSAGSEVFFDGLLELDWDSVLNANGYDVQAVYNGDDIVNFRTFTNTYTIPPNPDYQEPNSLQVRVRPFNNQLVGEYIERNYVLAERPFNLTPFNDVDRLEENLVGVRKQLVQGTTDTIYLNIDRPESGSTPIDLSVISLPTGITIPSLPQDIQGVQTQFNLRVGAPSRADYNFILQGDSPFQTKQRTVYITVRDIFDEFPSNLMMWFRAEDVVASHGERFSTWEAHNRAVDFNWRWYQGTLANQWRWHDGSTGSPPIPGRPSVYQDAGSAEARFYALQDLSGSAKTFNSSPVTVSGVTAHEVTVFMVLVVSPPGAYNPDGGLVVFMSGENTALGRGIRFGSLRSFFSSGFNMRDTSLTPPVDTPSLISFRVRLAATEPTSENPTTPRYPFDVIGRRGNALPVVLFNDAGGGLDVPSRSTEWRINRFGSDTTVHIDSVFRGHIYEMIFFNRRLTPTESNVVNRYLSAKYNLNLLF